MVLDVAGGEHTGHTRLRPVVGDQVAALVRFELTPEDLRVRRVTDTEEEPVERKVGRLAGLDVLETNAGHHVVAEHLFRDRVPENLQFGVVESALLHDLRRPQFVPPVDEIHFGRELGQVRRLFHRRVAAADDADHLVPVEEPVAGGAGGNALPHQPRLRLESEVAGGRAGGDDHRLGEHLVAFVDGQPEGPLRKIDGGHLAGHHLRAEPDRLRAKRVHQFRAGHALGEPGVVFHVVGSGQLASRLHPLEKDRGEIGPCRINRRRESGRAGADNGDAILLVHVLLSLPD